MAAQTAQSSFQGLCANWCLALGSMANGGCVGSEGRAWRWGMGCQPSVMLDRTRGGKGSRMGHRPGAG